MSLFADYKKEREGRECIERDWGFITYGIDGDSCYIEDLYVRPDYRRQKGGSALADMAAEHALKCGCKTLWGSVVPSSKGATESMKALLAYGFRLHSSKENFILLAKDLM